MHETSDNMTPMDKVEAIRFKSYEDAVTFVEVVNRKIVLNDKATAYDLLDMAEYGPDPVYADHEVYWKRPMPLECIRKLNRLSDFWQIFPPSPRHVVLDQVNEMDKVLTQTDFVTAVIDGARMVIRKTGDEYDDLYDSGVLDLTAQVTGLNYATIQDRVSGLASETTTDEIAPAINVFEDSTPVVKKLNHIVFGQGTSSRWNANPEYNWMFLRQVENSLNERLLTKKMVCMNDILSKLGIELQPEGYRLAWFAKDEIQFRFDYGDTQLFDGVITFDIETISTKRVEVEVSELEWNDFQAWKSLKDNGDI